MVVRLRFVILVRSGVVPAILSCGECIGLVHKENLPEVLKKHILSINAPDGAVCYRSVSCDLAVVTKHRQSN